MSIKNRKEESTLDTIMLETGQNVPVIGSRRLIVTDYRILSIYATARSEGPGCP